MSFDLFGETALRISKWSAKKVIGGAENVAAAEYDSGSRDSRRGENGRNDRIKWLNGPRNIPFRNIYSEKKWTFTYASLRRLSGSLATR